MAFPSTTSALEILSPSLSIVPTKTSMGLSQNHGKSQGIPRFMIISPIQSAIEMWCTAFSTLSIYHPPNRSTSAPHFGSGTHHSARKVGDKLLPAGNGKVCGCIHDNSQYCTVLYSISLYILYTCIIYIYITWYDMIWYDMIWYMIWYDMIWYDMIWYMIWYDMIYDMIWYAGMLY